MNKSTSLIATIGASVSALGFLAYYGYHKYSNGDAPIKVGTETVENSKNMEVLRHMSHSNSAPILTGLASPVPNEHSSKSAWRLFWKKVYDNITDADETQEGAVEDE